MLDSNAEAGEAQGALADEVVEALHEHGLFGIGLAGELGGAELARRGRPPHRLAADAVLLDNAGGGRAAAEHLLDQGHTRIAYVGDSDVMWTASERLGGYTDALTAAGVEVDPRLVRTGSHDVIQAAQVVQELLTLPEHSRPTALFTANNRQTVGALHAMRSEARRPAVVGFDDFELADLLGITVIRHDPSLMGFEAAALAFARIAGEDGLPRVVTVPTELVPRGSGEVA